MTDPVNQTVNIFLKVDHRDINGYFNEHDPSPLYNRQLSNKLEQYFIGASASVKRYSVVFFKMICNTELDKKYSGPLIYAIRKHYNTKLAIREKEFERFRKRTWILLAISIAIVVICQGFLIVLFNENHNFQSGLSNIIDVFSWVVLWQPIDQLLFHWNPYLKDISLLRKMATAEVIYINNEGGNQNSSFKEDEAEIRTKIINKPVINEN